MELKDILAIAFATLIVVVVAHFAIFWVLRTLYPPTVVPMPAPVPETKTVHVSPESFTQEQHVSIPTYETAIPVETPRQEGSTSIADLQSNPVQGNAGMDTPVAQ
jgi:hypothetical protein